MNSTDLWLQQLATQQEQASVEQERVTRRGSARVVGRAATLRRHL